MLALHIFDKLLILEGSTLVTPDMLMEEVTLKASVRPISARDFATGRLKLGERLLEESGRLHEIQNKPRIAHATDAGITA